MVWTAWASLAALGVYFWTGVMAGLARVRHKVLAPSMDGPLPFQSAQRVQANTLEQLPLVLVPLWLCAWYLGDLWAAAGGLLWCLGRVLYALGYYRDPARRETGFVLGMVASALLICGTVVGLLMH
ncbi:MAPEG family protein [Massilia sp. Dwa41.01b]|uniref:MAPEG family protein n=1 Tax=unclassified Massilia TaxID=2609279 RepID=UPI00160209EC|nr:MULTISPECIES: MAPEG family protein [unclassified Massilia]QNA90875.1 MAPEG family protein [Massilia sp. Dwa41.01b]QNA98114.1 MAPEG family protein [Massilia sp. Se16.2.3]